MSQLTNALIDVLETGDVKTDRTGTGTVSKFGRLMRFSLLNDWWPVETTRKVAWMKTIEELQWFMKGGIHESFLAEKKNHIWGSWTGQDGTIGPMYGEQWRNWTTGLLGLEGVDRERLEKMLYDRALNFDSVTLTVEESMGVVDEFLKERRKPYEQGGRAGIDQLAEVVHLLRNNPDSRRIIVSTWNTPLMPDTFMSPSENVDAGNMALAPCHTLWQVNTAPLSLMDKLIQIILQKPDEDSLCAIALAEANPVLMGETASTIHAVRRVALERFCNADPRFLPHDKQLEALNANGMKAIREWNTTGRPQRKLSLMLFARSQDLPLGTVFNIPCYAMLAKYLAHITNMVPFEYIHVMGDYHIYLNQIEQVNEQIQRSDMATPKAVLDPSMKEIEDFDPLKIQVTYESHPAIKYPMAAI